MSGYIYHAENSAPDRAALLVLHGTGGDEFDLIPLAKEIGGQDIPLLSLRGDVNENGQLRFFKRYADGSFDLDDLRTRADTMAAFIRTTAASEGIDLTRLYAFGYSNGANMAAALMLLHPDILAGGVLLRATIPLTPETIPSLADKKLLILSGLMDHYIPPEKGQELADVMTNAGADVTFKARIVGHELQPQDIIEAKTWFDKATA